MEPGQLPLVLLPLRPLVAWRGLLPALRSARCRAEGRAGPSPVEWRPSGGLAAGSCPVLIWCRYCSKVSARSGLPSAVSWSLKAWSAALNAACSSATALPSCRAFTFPRAVAISRRSARVSVRDPTGGTGSACAAAVRSSAAPAVRAAASWPAAGSPASRSAPASAPPAVCPVRVRPAPR